MARWNPHCNLGKMVKEVVSEFCSRPPVPVAPGKPAQGNEGYAQKEGPAGAETAGGKTAHQKKMDRLERQLVR